ncbi:MAG: glycosyltransferase family 9 protein [Bryobacterales bacterium]|nr:glycosyltransferase family 9 protein [Bryobacterales bacterium]
MIRPGAIGDCLVSFPAIESLAPDEVWIRSPLVPLVQFSPRCSPLSATGLDLVGIPNVDWPPALLERLNQFDSIVSWYGSNRAEFREAVARRHLPFHFLPALPPAGDGRHAVDFYLHQTLPLRVNQMEAVPRIPVRSVARGSIVIQPFSGSSKKNWPLDRFHELARDLPWPVEWCCSPEEHLAGARQFDSLKELAEWIGGARLYIGNDSGISHLAAAVGTPTIVLFGPADPAVWAPRGPWVQVVQAPGGRVEDLKPDAVRLAAKSFLRSWAEGTVRPVC